ncbi:hypothetical protein MKY91_20585 [Alkalicoccobacillus gibsonii]|uniref:Uncharacterized protein n=1 Tax=Alkalicoccobacillus gibsonii TaxID=79881 RepID=A0ABU9VRR3_9BACI
MKTKQRQIRSDKKIDVRPTIPAQFKQIIGRLSYIVTVPEKDIIEFIINSAIRSETVLDGLSKYFVYDYMYGTTLHLGSYDNPSIKEELNRLYERTEKVRATTRLKQTDYDNLFQLANSLNCTRSCAAWVLIERGIKDHAIIQSLLRSFLENELDPQRMKQLEEMIHFINKNKESGEEDFTLIEMLSYFRSQVKNGTGSIISHLKKLLD